MTHASSRSTPPRYERPVLLPLGELAIGWGQTCSFGSSASTQCSPGNSISQGAHDCSAGSTPTNGHCFDGGSPPKQCKLGGTK